MTLDRREFLAGAAALGAGAGLAGEAAAQAARPATASVLRVIPHANLSILDPLATTGYIVRNHGYLVYDTLVSVNERFEPQPQMLERWDRSADGLTWRLTLREGLAWHDGSPVTADDCAQSLIRWGRVDTLGVRLFSHVESCTADGNRVIVLRLRVPYPLVLESIGKPSSNVPFMMPKRIAETPHDRRIEDAMGSGPFIFRRDQWRPGQIAVYERNPNYRPRSEAPSWASGGKVAKVDRVEWLTPTDATTSMNALMSGEVDYWEQVPTDLLPVVQAAPGVRIELRDSSIGNVGMARFNHLVAPTNNALVRRAVMRAINQDDFMRTAIGNPQYFRQCLSVFTCGTPFETDGAATMRQNLDEARQLLRQANYNNERLVILQPTDIPNLSNFSLVLGEACRRVGINADVQAMDWATVLNRRTSRNPIDQGGWNVFCTWWEGVDLLNPIGQFPMSGLGERGWVGWSSDAQIEELRNQFSLATDLAEQRRLAAAVQARAVEQGFQAYLGQFFVPTGVRDNISGVLKSPLPLFWNIEKRART